MEKSIEKRKRSRKRRRTIPPKRGYLIAKGERRESSLFPDKKNVGLVEKI